MRLSHILVQNKFEAEDVLRLLQSGEAFADLARRFSTCSSAQAGGDLGDVPLEKLDRDFAEAAKILAPGKISPIIRTRFGYHLIFRAS